MNLIFIYGTPAVGKLTVAKALAQKIDYKVFHIHLTVDLVYSVFAWGSKIGESLNEKYRLDIVENAAKENIDLIMTFVYGHPIDEPFVKKMKEKVENNNGKVLFVKLFAEKHALEKRIQDESRKGTMKMKEYSALEGLMNKYDLVTEIQLAESLIIDNTNKSANQVANEIVKHYKLKKSS